MTWQEALQLTNLILIPLTMYLVRLEKRLVKLEVKLAFALKVLAKKSGIDFSEIEE